MSTDIRVGGWGKRSVLRRWVFSPQKPLRRAYERDPLAVRRWARQEQATIYWGEETGMRSDRQAGR